jgi:hypothetical protein
MCRHLAGLMLALVTALPAVADPPPLGVGLRRSEYGLRSKNGDDSWWVARAKQYAAAFPGAQPVIIQIVSTYLDEGGTEFGFRKPAGYTGPTAEMTFQRGRINHERALTAYDQAGVKAIIQFEPGDADMVRCIEIAHAALGKHPCIVGYGVDAEWYRTKHSTDKEKTGVPVPDAEAKAWTEKVVSLNKDYTFFIKHFEPKHLPPTYRHPNLWFLSDSQEFASRDECLTDFKDWAKATTGSTTGYQFGYAKDRKWWSKLANPPLDLGADVRKEIPSCRYLFWVDFTADKVAFEKPPGR